MKLYYRVPSPPWSLISHGQSGTENSDWCWFPIRAGDLALRFTRKKACLIMLGRGFSSLRAVNSLKKPVCDALNAFQELFLAYDLKKV